MTSKKVRPTISHISAPEVPGATSASWPSEFVKQAIVPSLDVLSSLPLGTQLGNWPKGSFTRRTW